jgi:YidC/Oxa1 family membrane protein insertase
MQPAINRLKVRFFGDKVLKAPSWQTDKILDLCISDLLKELLGKGFEVVVRSHPEYVKRYGPKMDAIVARYADYNGNDLSFELDFSGNTSIFDSDVVKTDWFGTAYEFAFVTCKPAVFIDTPPKIHNTE